MKPLDRLGHFAETLTWSKIPASGQQRAHLAFRDTVGTIIGGSRTRAGQIASHSVERRGPDAAGGPLKAFVTAVRASALDFDDGHYLGGAIHPGSVVVSSLLVAAQELDTTVRGLLTAQVVGYEIALRAAHLLWPRHEFDDYHCTGTAATLGAAAAVATLRGSDADTIARAIAIAWAHAPMSTFQLPMVKESIGWSACTALFAADLADHGFMAMPAATRHSAIADTFPPTPFDRPGAMDDPFVSSLGTVFESANTYFKPYAACRYIHTAARSLTELLKEESLTAHDIASIDVFTHRGAANLTDVVPASLDHGQYSFPFVLATVACTGSAGPDQISEGSLALPDRLAFGARVRVHYDAELDAHYPAHYASRLVVTPRSGSRLERIRLVAPGDPGDPMSDAELADKFASLSRPAFGDASEIVAAQLLDADLPNDTLRVHMDSTLST